MVSITSAFFYITLFGLVHLLVIVVLTPP